MRKNRFVLALILFGGSLSLVSLMHIRKMRPQVEKLVDTPLQCQDIEGILGPEDIALSKEGVVIASSDDRYAPLYDGRHGKGTLVAVKKQEQGWYRAPLESDMKGDLHPRGISLYESGDTKTLFVINYKVGQIAIEVFSWLGSSLSHRQSLVTRDFVQPSAIAAIDNHRFFVINEHGLFTQTGHFIEEFFALKKASLLFYDGDAFHEMEPTFGAGFGISYDAERKHLYVSDLREKKLMSYTFYPESPSLTLIDEKPLNFHPAHIKYDPAHGLIIAGHVDLFQSKNHMLNPVEFTAPSHIIRMKTLNNGSFGKVQVLFSNSTGRVSAASSAMIRGGELFIGSPFGKSLLNCKLFAQKETHSLEK